MCKDSFCIYGAGIVATSVYKAIKTVYHQQPLFFLVSDIAEGKKDENPTAIDGIPVLRLSAWQTRLQKDRECTGASRGQDTVKPIKPEKYLLAVPEVHHQAIIRSLSDIGIPEEKLVLITNGIENQIMREYFNFLYPGKTVYTLLDEPIRYDSNVHEDEAVKQCMIGGNTGIQVFQAKCHVDKPLKGTIQTPVYVVPIQVGTVFADRQIAEVQDNIGDNISSKNRNYCELTATYYAWKNSDAAYKGLCHYRRIFDITEEQMQNLLGIDKEWDVILPYPSVHYPDISAQHTRYINEEDWQAMLQAMRETAPEYLEAYEKAVSCGEQYFFNFNMLIAKAEVFDDYCDFLFKVLTRAEELTTPKGWERVDRFAGYMGENLTTIYFLKNRDRLKIVYAGKLWLT